MKILCICKHAAWQNYVKKGSVRDRCVDCTIQTPLVSQVLFPFEGAHALPTLTCMEDSVCGHGGFFQWCLLRELRLLATRMIVPCLPFACG